MTHNSIISSFPSYSHSSLNYSVFLGNQPVDSLYQFYGNYLHWRIYDAEAIVVLLYSQFMPCQWTLPMDINTVPVQFSSGSVQFSSVQFSSVQFSSVQFSSVQFSSVQFSSVQFSSVQFSSVQFSSVQFSSVQFSSVQFSSVQFSSVQFSSVSQP